MSNLPYQHYSKNLGRLKNAITHDELVLIIPYRS